MAGDDVELRITAEDDSVAALEKARTNIKELGTEAEKAAPKVKSLDARLGELGGRTERARPGMEKYGQGLDNVGNRFDEMDTRAMGTADGITGVTELMRHGELSASEMAMAFSDVGSSMYNTVIPSLKGAKEGFGNFIQGATGAKTTLGGLGRAAVVAGGVAGIAFLTNALIEAEDKAKSLEVERLTEEFMGLGDAVKAADLSAVGIFRGDLDKVFDNLLQQSPRLAEDMIIWAENAGFASEKTDEWRDRLNRAADAQDGLAEAAERGKTSIELEAEATAAFNDELDRLLGKTFDVNEAQSNLTVAIADATETVKTNKAEIGSAATSLDIHTEAGARNSLMIQDLVDQEADYIKALQESGIGNEELNDKIQTSILGLEGQLIKMGFTRDEVRVYTAALRQVPKLIRTDIGVRGVEQSIHDIGRIQAEINNLRGRDVGIRIVGTSVGFAQGGVRLMAHGGIVGAATGGVHGGLRLVGEHGPELAEFPTGTRINSNPDTERLLAGADGPTEVRVTIDSSGAPIDRLLAEILRNYAQVTAGGDVQMAFGGRAR